jgi:hypothetical protein
LKFKQIVKNPLISGNSAQSCNLPEVHRLILVASGVVSGNGKEWDFAKDDLSPELLELSKNEN